jgi:hypothetical protein
VVLQHSVGFYGIPEMMLVSITKKTSDPANVIYRLCNLLSGWAFLQTDQDIRSIEKGVEKPKMVIREAYACAHGWALAVLRIVAS